MLKLPLLGAAALSLLVPAAALADDPNDPAMRSSAARARDKAMTRKLNQDQLARVRARDARYAEQWRAWKAWRDAQDGARRDRRDED